MINDLLENFLSSSAFFADDVCFWEVGNNIEELNKMAHNLLNKIGGWCDENEITILILNQQQFCLQKSEK